MLVLWADERSTNLGVRVLAEGTRAAVHAAAPDATVSFQSYGPGSAPEPFRAPALAGMARPGGSRTLNAWLREHALVIDTGAGDSFAGIYGMRRHLEMSVVRRRAIACGVPLVMGPQTVGPFPRRAEVAVARWSLRGARAVVARDTHSLREATRLFRTPSVLATDTVFNLPRPARHDAHDVLVNVSGLLWRHNPHVPHDHYRTVVTRLVRSLLANGRQVSLLAHVLHTPGHHDDDVSVLDEVATHVGPGLGDPVIPADLGDVRRHLAGARVVVGSRMHACLNSVSVGTPAVPLAYSRKFAPLFDDLGWPHVMDLREPVETLVPKAHDAVALLTEAGPAAVEPALREAELRARRFVETIGGVLNA